MHDKSQWPLPAQTWLTRIEALHPAEIELGLDRFSIVAQRLGLTPDPPDVNLHTLSGEAAISASVRGKSSTLAHSDDQEKEQGKIKPVHNSEGARKIITVAGTNGKGSTVRALEALCLASGVTCAAYTSPHLVEFGERLRFEGQSTRADDWVPYFERVELARLGGEGVPEIPLTFFEFTTLAAFLMLFESTAQVWILEIGLGGRLDAVNWLNPTVAVVTRIALDHAQWLGSELTDIAREKCGIFRAHRPALWCDAAAEPAVAQAVYDAGASCHVSRLYDERCFGFREQDGALVFYGLDASGQAWTWAVPTEDRTCASDAAHVLSALGRMHPAAWAAALQAYALIVERAWSVVKAQVWPTCWLETRLPGRFEVVVGREGGPGLWIFDVAHNMDALLLLVDKLKSASERESLPELTCVFGVMSDKPWMQMMQHLAPWVARWLLVCPETPRSVPAKQLYAAVREMGASGEVIEAPQAQWHAKVREHVGPEDAVLVCGSFFTVGPFYANNVITA